MYFGLSKEQKEKLRFEVISHQIRLNIAMLFRDITVNNSSVKIITINNMANIARQIEGLPLHKLEFGMYDSDYERYHEVEYAWHYAELELIVRRPNSVYLIEIICDLIQVGIVQRVDINEIFSREKSSGIFFIYENNYPSVEIKDILEYIYEDSGDTQEHPNIRLLMGHMKDAFAAEDWSLVSGTSGSIFETLAKDVIKNPNIENKSLGSFFDSYRKSSNLPGPILDMIILIFNKRNTEPLAAHGKTNIPTITKDDAVIIFEITKAFISMERTFANNGI
jgi:hypothetical protein